MLNVPPSTLVPFFTIAEREVSTTPALNAVQLAPSNGSRVLLVISNQTNNSELVIGTNAAQVSSGNGIRVPLGGRPYELRFSDWGPIVGREWFVQTIALADDVYVYEVIYRP